MTTSNHTQRRREETVRLLLTDALTRPVPCPRCQRTNPCRCYVPPEDRQAARVDVLLDALRPALTPPAAPPPAPSGQPAGEGLPPFSGDNAACPKCGYQGASTVHHPGRSLLCGAAGARGEHLCRACLRCEYGWSEALAQPPDAGDQPAPDGARPATRITVTCHGQTEILEFPAGEATELERVNAELRAAGIEHPPGARGVHDLAGVLSGQVERAEEAEQRARQAESRLAGQRDLLGRWAAEYDRIMTLLGEAMEAGRDITTAELRRAIEPLTAVAATAHDQTQKGEGSCSSSL